MLRVVRSCALVLALTFVAPLARAQEVEGNVVALQGTDVVIDLGAARGLAVGDVVDVWRPLRLKHPVTGATITDRFRIARLKVAQVRPAVAIARLEGDAERALAPGDVVVAPRREGPPAATAVATPPEAPRRPAKDADVEKPSAAKPSAATTVVTTTTTTTTRDPNGKVAAKGPDLDAQELHELFLGLRGATPEQRAAAYKRHVMEHPQSRHAKLLWEEAEQLERVVAEAKASAVEARAQAAKRQRTPILLGFNPPRQAPSGAPLRLALEIAKARGAVFHLRRRGEAGFVSTAMTETGPAYYATTLDADVMREGVLEYFVESTDAAGEAKEVAGSAEAPLALEVEPPPDRPAREAERRTVTASAFTDYASFNAKNTNDYVWQSEALLGVRLRDVGLRALRSGFGAYRGRGGTLAELDEQKLDGRAVGLTYGYLEAEIGIAEAFSIAGRAIVGLREAGVNGGAQGFLRIGSDRKTNLLVGGEVLGGIGLRGITQLELNGFPRFPITLRSEVTNQPAGVAVSGQGVGGTSRGPGEVGIRSIAQIGYRVTPRFVVAARGSFQARTINHAGPGAGAAVTYEW